MTEGDDEGGEGEGTGSPEAEVDEESRVPVCFFGVTKPADAEGESLPWCDAFSVFPSPNSKSL